MRTKHWKLLPCFLTGLLVMLAAAWAVGTGFGVYPALGKVHWILWLVLTLVFPLLALFIHGRERKGLYPLSYLVNALGAGCAFGIALGFLEVPVQERFGELLLSAAFPALTALVMCLLFTLWRRTRWIAVGFTFLVLPAVIGVCSSEKAMGSWPLAQSSDSCFSRPCPSPVARSSTAGNTGWSGSPCPASAPT